MKRLFLSSAILLLALGGLNQSAPAQGASNPEDEAPPPAVVISEVCYWPKENEPEWVEIANLSENDVDIKGWQLLDGHSFELTISEKSLVMPPKSYLVVKFDGTGQPPTRSHQNQATAYSPRGALGNLLGDKGGHLALYSAAIDFYHPPQMSSYVAWGHSPGRIIADAIKSDRWFSSSAFLPDFTVRGTGPGLASSPTKVMQQGGSIGLVTLLNKPGYIYERWGVFGPSEVNPGRFDIKREVGISPLSNRTTDSSGNASISVIGLEEGVKYQFQIYTDKTCQQIFLDTTREHENYALEKPVPPSTTYYWRARLIFPDGSLSSWSEVQSITNAQRK